MSTDPIDWLRSVVHQFLPVNSPRYSASVYASATSRSCRGSALPFLTGKVVADCVDWLLIKIRLGQFAVIDRAMLAEQPPVGSFVEIWPYHVRDWHGKSLPAAWSTRPAELAHAIRSPIDTDALGNPDLIDLVHLLGTQFTNDHSRTIAQVLIDAGADASNTLIIGEDPVHLNHGVLPGLQFRVNGAKHCGYVLIEVSDDPLKFRISFADYSWGVVTTRACSNPNDLADELENSLSDPSWSKARVYAIGKRFALCA